MKIGSIAIALIAEYGEFCPSAISLIGSSCTNEKPGAGHPGAEPRQIADLADAPALARRQREQRHEQPGVAAVKEITRHRDDPAPARTPRANDAGSGSRLTTRNASCGKSKKYPGCTTTASRSSSSMTSASSERVDGTRSTADHPPSGREHRRAAGARHDRAPARRRSPRTRSRICVANGSALARAARAPPPGRGSTPSRYVSQISSSRSSASATSSAGPSSGDPSELHLRQPDALRQAAQAEQQARRRRRTRAARRTAAPSG